MDKLSVTRRRGKPSRRENFERQVTKYLNLTDEITIAFVPPMKMLVGGML
jgi:hypothetical protein